MLRAFPKMLIAVVAYNVLIFGGGFMGHPADALLARNVPVMVFSGDLWKVSLSDALVTLALPTYEATRCPLCAQGVPVVKPGSRPT